MPSCTLLVLGHLPSPDNKKGLRSRDIDCDQDVASDWLESIALARPLLRCFGLLIAGAYCPDTVRHASSARLLTKALGLAQPIEDARLNNIDYGRYKGRPLAETPRLAELDERYDGGESWGEVASRWRAFCAEVLTAHASHVVLLAGQSATAPRMLRHLCKGVPLREAVDQPVPTIPFFSTKLDFPTENLVWRYSW